MGVEGGEGEEVGGALVHGEEDFAGFHVGGEVGLGGDASTAGGDGDLGAVVETELGCVFGMDVEEERVGVEFFKDSAFVGARLGVPLRTGSASGEESEGVVVARWFGERGWWIEEELGALIGCVEFSVFEEATLRCEL